MKPVTALACVANDDRPEDVIIFGTSEGMVGHVSVDGKSTRFTDMTVSSAHGFTVTSVAASAIPALLISASADYSLKSIPILRGLSSSLRVILFMMLCIVLITLYLYHRLHSAPGGSHDEL
jgi:hypothetical protein